jgi:predicted AlkP superfamily phosphohydrolase/phosphomutase
MAEPPRLILIGLDGATWDLLDPMIEAGRLPNLARLRRDGVHGPLRSMLPSLSPALWTTIATGKRPEVHGITDFFRVDEKGRKVPVDQTLRRARTFWEVLGDSGRTSCIVYWWNTWPAAPIRGALVSDYLFYSRNAIQNARPVERAELLARAAYPPELAPLLARRLEEAAELSPDLVRSIVDFDDEAMRSFLEGVESRLGEARTTNSLSVLKAKLIESEFHRTIGLDLVTRTHFDFWVYYSKGIDATGHAFWRFFEPDAPFYANQPARPEDIALYGEVIPRFYQYEDRNVGRVLERAGPETWVLVVSDHGHHAGGHEDGPDGVMIFSGPGVRCGERVEGVRIEDVAPLVLHLFDVPVGEDLSGRVPTELFTEVWNAEHPVRTVATHEKDREAEPALVDEAVADALMQELRALGYVE